jgi:hypothetical protein
MRTGNQEGTNMSTRRVATFAFIVTLLCVMDDGVWAAHKNVGATGGEDFVGIWQYHDKQYPPNVTHYLKLRKAGPGRYQMTEGFKDGSQPISWTEGNQYCDSHPIISLTPTNGGLQGKFVADCFRATHGLDFTYQVRVEILSKNSLSYSLWSMQGKSPIRGQPDTFEAIRVGGGGEQGGAAAAEAGGLQIGAIRNQSLISGCACNLLPYFSADVTCRAWMNINGRDVELHAKGRKSGPEVADGSCRQSPVYIGSGITVKVEYRETSPCPPEPSECEISGYNMTISVEMGGKRQRVTGKGEGGC